jgi:hypothetical protein
MTPQLALLQGMLVTALFMLQLPLLAHTHGIATTAQALALSSLAGTPCH